MEKVHSLQFYTNTVLTPFCEFWSTSCTQNTHIPLSWRKFTACSFTQIMVLWILIHFHTEHSHPALVEKVHSLQFYTNTGSVSFNPLSQRTLTANASIQIRVLWVSLHFHTENLQHTVQHRKCWGVLPFWPVAGIPLLHLCLAWVCITDFGMVLKLTKSSWCIFDTGYSFLP